MIKSGSDAAKAFEDDFDDEDIPMMRKNSEVPMIRKNTEYSKHPDKKS